MDRSLRMLAAVTALLAAVFLTMGRIIDSAPVGEWGLPVLVFLVGAALLFWDYYESHPRASLPLDGAEDEPAPVREFTPQLAPASGVARPLPIPPPAIVSDSAVGANRTVDRITGSLTITPDTPALVGEARSSAAADAAMPPLSSSAPGLVETVPTPTFVSDPATQLREDAPTPSIAEIDAATPSDTVPSPEYVGEETAPETEHPGAITTDAVSKPRPFSAGAVTAAPVSDSPHMTESGSRDNATKEAPPLASIPQDKSVQATDKSAPANDPATVTVLEANNASLGKQSIGAAVGEVTPQAAEAAAPAVQQATAENADASTKAVTPNTPLPTAGDTPAPAAQDAAMPTANTAPAAARSEADAAPAPTDSIQLPPAPSERAKDDLTLIEGIGPKIAGALVAGGVTTFDKLASLPEAELRSILSAAKVRIVGSISASIPTWQDQAGMAARGELDALRAWQASHKFGAGD